MDARIEAAKIITNIINMIVEQEEDAPMCIASRDLVNACLDESMSAGPLDGTESPVAMVLVRNAANEMAALIDAIIGTLDEREGSSVE